jgi:hypothetical protein
VIGLGVLEDGNAGPQDPGGSTVTGMSTTPDWLLIVTGLGAGVAGSVITTYGTQTRERRQARAQTREAIRQLQNLFVSQPTHEQLTAALDNLETSAIEASRSVWRLPLLGGSITWHVRRITRLS